MEIYGKAGNLLAIIGSSDNFKSGLNFFGDHTQPIQVGSFKFNAYHKLTNHRHIKRERVVDKTQEVLIVLSGLLATYVFDDDNTICYTITLKAGEFIIVYHAGVGYEILEDDTKLLEVKVGPYVVESDDEDRELIK